MKTPAWVAGAIFGADNRLSLARYLLIGGFVFCINFVIFQALLAHGIFRPVATASAYIAATAVHFTLNRFLNFRNFERSVLQQLRSYVAIISGSLFLSIIVVEIGVRHGLSPLQGNFVAVVINLPVGYLAHRYLTFGAGISSALRRAFAAAAKS